MAKCYWYQCYQLLSAHHLQIHRCYWNARQLAHYWCLWYHQAFRRTLLALVCRGLLWSLSDIVGSVGGAFRMYYVAAYIAIAKPQLHPATTLSSGGKCVIAFFYLWPVFYSPSSNGISWVSTAEVFPQHTRTFTQACMAANNWLYSFLIARFTPQSSLPWATAYLFFASLMVLSIAFVFLFVPETKQVPLERMEEIFAPGLPAWRAHSTVVRELRSEKHEYGNGEEKDQGSVETFEKAPQASVYVVEPRLF
ncbi:hypothetical protein BT96DRAFT_657693 [Gymnopus androsaceus JB14]|uniref:Major facilitator superfamily (MFS) profile domain-containing protein n=1 Tax=Gymnopus androsaceus JB14 TaxID=1447944 RepID=A0A6A4HTS6_9AGAR|nr:hypothetical protein BT96DRAFT_657693 [Gymnopus androsaceus JB14]